MTRDARFTDVVCGMDISSDDIGTDHLGIRYAFCSQQCLQRFLSHPHLYTGRPGIEAPVHAGMNIIKSRTLKLSEPIPQELADRIVDALIDMMGVQLVVVQEEHIRITYDLLQVTEELIEDAITNAGAALGDGWVDNLKRAFIQPQEETEMAALEAQSVSMLRHEH